MPLEEPNHHNTDKLRYNSMMFAIDQHLDVLVLSYIESCMLAAWIEHREGNAVLEFTQHEAALTMAIVFFEATLRRRRYSCCRAHCQPCQ
jgi:hypothetical protein